MAKVTIYTKSWCGYCHRALALLRRKGVPYDELDVTHDATLEQEMVRRSGNRSVPQIFIGDQPVGGSDDLYALEAEGRLDSLLAG
jgi:glutaredoxin 3